MYGVKVVTAAAAAVLLMAYAGPWPALADTIEAALVRACSEYERARNDLFTTLADTFSRYDTNRQTVQQYRSSILVDQVRAYRGAYQRYQVDPDADFNDVVTSQQTLASTISTYIQLLGDQWQAVADLAGLMQSDDIFALGQTR